MQIACLQIQRLDIWKIESNGGLDPFSSDFFGEKLELVHAICMVSYLVLQTSFITSKQFKAYISLMDSYNQFVCGWMLCDYRTGKYNI